MVLVFLVAAIVRLYFVLELHPPGLYIKWDMANYDHLADRLLRGELSPWDAYIPPGYPGILAIIYAVCGKSYGVVGMFQALAGGAAAALTYPLARRLHGSRLVAFLAALGIALHVPLVVYTGFLLTESTFVLLLVLFAVLLITAHDRRSSTAATAAGIVFAVGCAVRPNLVFALPFLGVLALPRPARRVRFALGRAFVVAMPLLLAVAARNTLAAGRPAFLATHGGLNFYLAHAKVMRVALDPNDPIVGVSGNHNRHHYTAIYPTGRHAYDEAYFYREAVRIIVADPVGALEETVSNFADGVGLGPQGTWPEQAYWPGYMGHDAAMNAFGRAAFYVGVLPTLLFGAWRLARRLGRQTKRREDPSRAPRRMLFALAASALFAVSFFCGDPRVRVSFDPIFLVLASEPLARGLALTRRRGAQAPREAHAAA